MFSLEKRLKREMWKLFMTKQLTDNFCLLPEMLGREEIYLGQNEKHFFAMTLTADNSAASLDSYLQQQQQQVASTCNPAPCRSQSVIPDTQTALWTFAGGDTLGRRAGWSEKSSRTRTLPSHASGDFWNHNCAVTEQNLQLLKMYQEAL